MVHVRRPAAFAAAAITALTLTVGAAQGQSYIVRQLPTLGGFISNARDINDSGVIVGFSTRGSDSVSRAVKWTSAGIADLDPMGWWRVGEAVAINNNGFALTNQQGALNCFPEGVQVMAPTGTTPIWRMNYANKPSTGRGINATMQTVGCAADTSGAMIPLRWLSTAPSAVGPTTGVVADVADINDAGVAVGHSAPLLSGVAAANVSAIRIQGTQISTLPTPADRTRAHARAINGSGTVVGDADNGVNPCAWLNVDAVAVRWSPTGQLDVLPLPANVWSASATEINDRGEIVGLGVRTDWTFGPVIWRSGGADPRFLADVVSDMGGMDTIDRVEAINNHGQMVGWGFESGTGIIKPIVISPCWADFNGVGGIGVQDVFDFLSTYFAGSIRADADRSGALGSEDLFVFLSSYFSGCR